jgi:hypothetical protein
VIRTPQRERYETQLALATVARAKNYRKCGGFAPLDFWLCTVTHGLNANLADFTFLGGIEWRAGKNLLSFQTAGHRAPR